jgi:hypothetical protein
MPIEAAGGAPPPGAPPPSGGGGPPPDMGERITKMPIVMGQMIEGLGNIQPEVKQMFEQSAAMWQQGVDMMGGGEKKAPEAAPPSAPPAPPKSGGGREQFIG